MTYSKDLFIEAQQRLHVVLRLDAERLNESQPNWAVRIAKTDPGGPVFWISKEFKVWATFRLNHSPFDCSNFELKKK